MTFVGETAIVLDDAETPVATQALSRSGHGSFDRRRCWHGAVGHRARHGAAAAFGQLDVEAIRQSLERLANVRRKRIHCIEPSVRIRLLDLFEQWFELIDQLRKLVVRRVIATCGLA